MNRKLDAVLDAVLPAALVATIAGAGFAAADYIALISGEHFLEQWAWLPPGWRAANGGALAVAAVLIASPVIAFVAVRMYRTARRSRKREDVPC